VLLAVDDLGTAHWSLASLLRVPFTDIKLACDRVQSQSSWVGRLGSRCSHA
jgi:EAL domain-containing protein (putative c-di-GMP-specific phosphodiesterase class I)